MVKVREVLFDLMRELGMTKIFGNVGSTEEPMLQNFPPDFEYILSLQESVAVAMADAYSQDTGKPVHVNLHSAAGSGNGMGNFQTAWYNRTPMIITAGQQVRATLVNEPYLTSKNPYLQALPWVKWCCQPACAEDIPAAFFRAYATAIMAPAGPVYLSLPTIFLGVVSILAYLRNRRSRLLFMTFAFFSLSVIEAMYLFDVSSNMEDIVIPGVDIEISHVIFW